MSGDSNAKEEEEEVVFEGSGGPNGAGVLVMGHADDDLSGDVGTQAESPQSVRSGDNKEGAVAGATDDSSDQDSSYVQVDRVENSNDSVHTDSDDMKVADDAGKEDMFVDAPDELGASATVMDSDETVERSIQETQFYEEGGIPAYHLVDEVEHLRSMLEKVTAERDALSQEKQEGWLQKASEIKELQEQLDLRDKEINDFTAKMISHELLRESSEVLNQNVQYVDVVLNQLLASLATVVYPGDLFDDSIAAKASLVERSSSMLVQNYTEVLSDVEQLRQFLNHRMVTGGQEDFRTVLTATRDELFELRAKEAELLGKLNYFEGQNKEFLEQMEVSKGTVESMNAEVAKLRSELEQEKGKSATLREKLSLAVTKGKGLVQQRDSLRQSLAEKTRELEERVEELQEKSRALEACELRNGDTVSNENLIASLQEALSQKNAVFTNIEELLSQGTLPDSTQFQDLSEKVKWLLEDRSTLVGAFLEMQRIRDAIPSLDIPETVASSDAVSVISWLNESLYLEKGEFMKLQDEIVRMKEAADSEIHRLSTSLSEEIRDRDFMKEELADLSEKLKTVVQKEQHLLQERNEAAKILLEASGMTLDNQEEMDQPSPKMSMLVAKCLSRTAKQTSQATESSHVEAENFERAVTLLYMKDLDLAFCLQLLKEDHSERSKVMKELDDLKVASEGLATVKEERDSLQRDLARAEEKVSTIREKLSMAVKKGKGLVQERENMKGHLDEKNQEIEKLMFEVQRQKSYLSDYTDQISRLSADVEQIPKLEADVVSIKDQKNQLEELLEVKNQKLRGIIDMVDGIALPTTLEFEEPLEKLKWIDSYLNESENLKNETGKELEKLKQEASHMDIKFAEFHSVINSLQDALLQKESDLSQIAEEKKELEAVKASIELELQKSTEESQDQSRKLVEISASLQDVVSQAENDIQQLSIEKEELRASCETELEKVNEEMANQNNKLTESYNNIRTLEKSLSQMEASISLLTEQSKEKQEVKSGLELELQKLRDEINFQAGQLADAHSTIKFLEDAAAKIENETSVLTAEKKIADEEIISLSFKLDAAYENIKALEDSISHMQETVSVLTEENSEAQLSRSNLESELQRLKDEISSQEASLADAQSTIKLLEDAALGTKNSMSTLLVEKKTAENEISELQSKLTACLEELSGTSGSIQSRSLEFIHQLKGLKALAVADRLASFSKRFEAPVEKLKNMDLILEGIRDHFADIGHPIQRNLGSSKGDLSITGFLRDAPSTLISAETTSSVIDSANVDEVNKLFSEVVDWLDQKDRYVEGFAAALDASTDTMLNKLQSSKNEMVAIADHMASLKQTIEDLELGTQKRDQTVSVLENDLHILVSACAEAEKTLLHLSPELEPASHDISEAMGDEVDSIIEREARKSNRYINAAKKLLLKTQEVHSLHKQMANSGIVASSTISDLQNELTEVQASLEEITQQRNVDLNIISNLEADLLSSQRLSSEMSLKIQDLQTKEEKLMEKEAEALLLYKNLSTKEQELKDCRLTVTQLKELLDTACGTEFPFEESGDAYLNGLILVKKLSYILDNYSVLQQKLDVLSGKKDELQSKIGKQTSEIQNLKEEILEHGKSSQGSQKLKKEFSEFTLHLERIVLKLGGSETSGDQSAEDAKRLLLVLDKLLSNLVFEYENSKSIVRELEAKSVESRKLVDSLSMKAQSLEEVIQRQTIVPQTIHERSFMVPSTSAGSEISEVEDVDLSGKSSTTPVPSAAQMRTLRKGSTDHLALNIDVESVPLTNNAETDEDKGHVFKSLNTSGLIPKQGKMLADRIDGIWVSGGRVLMNQPRARLGVIVYWLVLHLWLLASIL